MRNLPLKEFCVKIGSLYKIKTEWNIRFRLLYRFIKLKSSLDDVSSH